MYLPPIKVNWLPKPDLCNYIIILYIIAIVLHIVMMKFTYTYNVMYVTHV